MDKVTTAAAAWRPATEVWGSDAYEETKARFFQLVVASEKPWAQAFVLWALAQDAGLEGDSLMAFGGGCGDARPGPEEIEQARKTFGPPAKGSKPAKKAKRSGRKTSKRSLSGLEKAILADFQEASGLIDSFKKSRERLQEILDEFEAAKERLCAIEPHKARLIAQHDDEVSAIFRDLGILSDGGES